MTSEEQKSASNFIDVADIDQLPINDASDLLKEQISIPDVDGSIETRDGSEIDTSKATSTRQEAALCQMIDDGRGNVQKRVSFETPQIEGFEYRSVLEEPSLFPSNEDVCSDENGIESHLPNKGAPQSRVQGKSNER